MTSVIFMPTGGIQMKTSHRIKALRGVDVLQDKVTEEVLEAYYFFRTNDEVATINANLGHRQRIQGYDQRVLRQLPTEPLLRRLFPDEKAGNIHQNRRNTQRPTGQSAGDLSATQQVTIDAMPRPESFGFPVFFCRFLRAYPLQIRSGMV